MTDHKIRIAGLVKTRQQVTELLARNHKTGSERAVTMATRALESTAEILEEHGATPSDLPLPSRRAIAYLTAIRAGESHEDAERQAARVSTDLLRPRSTPSGRFRDAATKLARLLWKRRDEFLKDRGLMSDLVSRVKRLLEEALEGMAPDAGLEVLTEARRHHVLWLEFLLRRDHLKGTLKALDRAARAAREVLAPDDPFPEILLLPLSQEALVATGSNPRVWRISLEFYKAPKRIWKAIARSLSHPNDDLARRTVEEFLTSPLCLQYRRMLTLSDDELRHGRPPRFRVASRIGTQDARPSVPFGRGDMERQMQSITRLLESGASIDDLNKILQSVDGDLSALAPPQSAASRAQDAAYSAMSSQGRERKRFIKEALELDPDCTDALNLQAEDALPHDPELALQRYERARDAARRALDPSHFHEDVGHFWGILETRPYIRSLCGIAQTLTLMGRDAEARQVYDEILTLNEHDNTGARYAMAGCLLRLQDHKALRHLRRRFSDEDSLVWAYAETLILFRERGDSAVARRALKEAIEENAYLAELLLTGAPEPIPSSYTFGSREEAAVHLPYLLGAWQRTPGALEWLESNLGDCPDFR